MQNKSKYAIPTLSSNWRTNHTMMEYSLLNWCNHKVGLDGPMAYCLAWHIGLNSRSQIIPGEI